MNENSQTVDTLFLWSQSAILPNLLMTSCKSTYCVNLHIHRHNETQFWTKECKQGYYCTHPIISILAIIDHRGFKVFFSKLIFGPSIELKIDPPPPEFSPKKLNWNLICEKNWDQNFFCQCQFPIFFLVDIFMVTFQFSWEYFLGKGQQKGKWLEGRVERPAPKEFWGSSWRHLNWSS